MTTIEYDRTLDDMLNFNLYHIKSSPLLRRQVMLVRIVASIIVVILSFGLIYIIDIDKQLDAIAYITPLAEGILLFFLFPWLNNRGIRTRTMKLLKEGGNKGMLGRQRISLQTDGLYCEAPSSESKLKWDAIERVATNEDYVLI